MWQPDYHYWAEVVRVVDGDTVELLVDCGFGIHHRVMGRLYGIDAPEVTGPTAAAGDASTAHLEHLLRKHSMSIESRVRIVVKTHKDRQDKYGRYLFELIGASDGQLLNLNDQMLRDNHAVVAPWK